MLLRSWFDVSIYGLGLLGFLTVAAELCLDDGVPEEARHYILDNDGKQIPIGLLRCNWASSEIMTEIVQVLIRERLGFHAELHPVNGKFGASPFFALAGCDDFDDTTKRRCGHQETMVHVAMDAWISGYGHQWRQFQEEFPVIAPKDMGTMGYEGEETMYVSKEVLASAFGDAGLALDFYKSYNTTRDDPKKYFDHVQNISLDELLLCNESNFFVDSYMRNYIKFSGDVDGVLEQNGSFVAKCVHGRWWMAPTCRASFPECIPLFTAGNGWSLQSLMQWATAYSIPAALAISSSYSNWITHVETHRSLWYWWIPDSTFIEMEPEQVILPRHSPSGWARGDKSTGATGSYIGKMVSANLYSKASRVEEFVSSVLMELGEIMDLLLKAKRSSMKEAACDWIRLNRDKWEEWVTIETSCTAGFGLVDVEGQFLANRSGASTCERCAAGFFSQEYVDDKGKTHRCVPCAPGTSQSQSLSTTCEPCARGTFSNVPASKECRVCGVGFYQSFQGQMECSACAPDRTTQLLGATEPQDCVCKANAIETTHGHCVACSVGLWCPLGSTVTLLQSANGTDPSGPHVEAGYKADAENPLEVYKCTDLACPGGAPGTCNGGLEGLACGNCASGFYFWSETCQRCGLGAPVAWTIVSILLAIGIFISYYPLSFPYVAKASAFFSATASFGILFGLLQNLGVLSTALTWENGSNPLLRFASIFVFDLNGFGFSCAAEGNAKPYSIIASFFWLVVLLLPICAILTNYLPCLSRRGLAWEAMKTVNVIGHFLQVATTTMSSVALLPFMCYQHPSGKESVLKFPNVLCGSPEHITMQSVGISLMVLGVAFLAAACFAARMAPKWSGTRKLRAIVFLIQRFRPSTLWFGLVLLARGMLLSLPVVFATNMPGLHLMLMLGIQQAYSYMQLWFHPWKSPILNLGDAVSTGLLVSLLATSLACLDTCPDILQTLRAVVSLMLITSLVLLVLITTLNFFYVSVTRKQLSLLDLGKTGDADSVLEGLRQIADFLSRDREESTSLSKGLAKLCAYDLNCVMEAIDVLLDDWEIVPSEERRSTSASTSRSRSRISLAPNRDSLNSRGKGSKRQRVSMLALEEAMVAPVEADGAGHINGGSLDNSGNSKKTESFGEVIYEKEKLDDLPEWAEAHEERHLESKTPRCSL